jgi:hypothetical protein
MTSPRANGLLGRVDPTEVMTTDDQATRRSDEFLAMALLKQQVKAQGGLVIHAGTCTWCGERCQPLAVYCDGECRADHEAQLATLVKQGRAR